MKKNGIIVLVTAAALTLGGMPSVNRVSAANLTATIYVSPTGDDQKGKGSLELPYKTITKAQSAISALKNVSNLGEVKVILREGEYPPFTVSEKNGGTDTVKISYEAYRNEQVEITESATLSADKFEMVSENSGLYLRLPYEARANILEYDLTQDGISGVVPPAPLGDAQTAVQCEPGLFIDDSAMITARWPNNGYVKLYDYATADTPVYNTETSSYITVLQNLSAISNEKWLEAENVYIAGMLPNVFFYNRSRISSISEASMTVEGYVRADAPVCFINIPEELDSPGEWYYNPEENKIYLYPEKDITNSDIRFAYKGNGLIMGTADNITIDGLTLNGSYGTAVKLTGDKICVKNCVIKNGCVNAMVISGSDNRADSNHIYNMGMGGISFYPDWAQQWENMKTFTCDNNIITNNDIHDFNKIQKAYATGIYMYGVKSVASNNSIHDAEGHAVSIAGVKTIFEYNEIYNVATEVGDAGAIYVGGAWLNRGHEIRYNKIYSTQLSDYVSGIFFDDCASASKAYGNVIDGFASAIKIHGGMDHEFTDNVFSFAGSNTEVFDCGISINAKNEVEKLPDQKAPTIGTYKQELYHYAKEPAWQQEWPGLDTLFDREDYKVASNNDVANNIFVGYSAEHITNKNKNVLSGWKCDFDGNVVYENAADFYADYSDKDFRYEIPINETREYVFGKGNDYYYRRFMRDYIGENYNFEAELAIEQFPDTPVGEAAQDYRGATLEVDNIDYTMQFSIEKDGIYVLNSERERVRLREMSINTGEYYKYGVKVRGNNAQLYINDTLAGSFVIPANNIDSGTGRYDDIKISYNLPGNDNISFVMKKLKLDKVYPGGLVMVDRFDKEYDGPGTRTMTNLTVHKLSDYEEKISKEGLYSSDYIVTSDDKGQSSLVYTVPENCYITDISYVTAGNAVKQNIHLYLKKGITNTTTYFNPGVKNLVRKDVYGYNLFRCVLMANETGKESLLENKFTKIDCIIYEGDYDDSREYVVPAFLHVAIAYTGPGLENEEGIYNIYTEDFANEAQESFYLEFSSAEQSINTEPYVTFLPEGVRFKNYNPAEEFQVLPVEKMGLHSNSKTGMNNMMNYTLENVDKALYRVYDDGEQFKIKFYHKDNRVFDAMLAGYNDGKLVTIKKKTITGDDEILISKSGVTDIKLFIWDELSGGTPIEIASTKRYQ